MLKLKLKPNNFHSPGPHVPSGLLPFMSAPNLLTIASKPCGILTTHPFHEEEESGTSTSGVKPPGLIPTSACASDIRRICISHRVVPSFSGVRGGNHFCQLPILKPRL